MRSLGMLAVLLGMSGAESLAWEVTGREEVREGAVTSWQLTVREGVTQGRTVRVSAVGFSPRSVRLRVVPNADPPQKLAEIALRERALAGCNASYFHADGTPLGLVVSDGKRLHPQERAKLLSGVVAVRGGNLHLKRASEFTLDATVTQAVQSGPWLLERGRAVEGLESTKRARRTIVATDGRGRWWFLLTSAATLAEAASLLEGAPLFEGAKLRDALNMDGGSSSCLWSPSLSEPEYGTVVNFLLVVPDA
jgi:exopolysaccharide biosynthesis protein